MIDPGRIEKVGKGLVRPECVLATAAGDLFCGDWRGGIAHIGPDGRQTLYTATTSDLPEGLRPNGIALEQDGSFLFANLGDKAGGTWRLDRKGQVRPVLIEVDGKPVEPSNYVTRDAAGRLWLTVSSRKNPRNLDFRPDAATGYIVLSDARGTRIVADNLGFTNECMLDPKGEALYVIETCARRLSRFPLKRDGDLGLKEVVATFAPEGFPDGFAFDAEGGCWVTLVVSNQLVRVRPDGQQEVVLEDKDPAHVAAAEYTFRANAFERRFIEENPAPVLGNISSAAFGGPDLETLYLGCLTKDFVAKIKAPVKGHPPVHWHYTAPAS
jgi:sugar lactone lactonase YvrE